MHVSTHKQSLKSNFRFPLRASISNFTFTCTHYHSVLAAASSSSSSSSTSAGQDTHTTFQDAFLTLTIHDRYGCSSPLDHRRTTTPRPPQTSPPPPTRLSRRLPRLRVPTFPYLPTRFPLPRSPGTARRRLSHRSTPDWQCSANNLPHWRLLPYCDWSGSHRSLPHGWLPYEYAARDLSQLFGDP